MHKYYDFSLKTIEYTNNIKVNGMDGISGYINIPNSSSLKQIPEYDINKNKYLRFYHFKSLLLIRNIKMRHDIYDQIH